MKQVLIEARIVEATDNWERDLGIKLTYDRMDPRASFPATRWAPTSTTSPI
ncbi:Type II secretory pathway, component HofQ [Chromobacterium violaceum]|uniref:Type II secretory pathway, component HofQ n=1 Tax=Chromobacterium violaceum TaxID=536 RepID=A0A3S4LH86_CHRVL|nr:Type II secretory pathway, component HofQ [Chromobacterium violaceum]